MPKTDPRDAQIAALREALEWIMRELPVRRDWLDPTCERFCKEALAAAPAAKQEPE